MQEEQLQPIQSAIDYRLAQPLPQEYSTVGELWSIIWGQKFWILGAVSFCLIATLIWSIATSPVYQARTTVELEGLNESYLNIRDLSPTAPGASYTAEAYLQTQVRILQSETMARRVEKKLNLRSRPEYAYSGGRLSRFVEKFGIHLPRVSQEDSLLKAVSEPLSIQTSLNSRIIEIRYSSTDPKLAADCANTFAQEYILQSIEKRAEVAASTIQLLDRQTADLKKKLEDAGAQLQVYARESGLIFTPNKDTLAEERIRQLQTERSEAQADLATKQSLYEVSLKATPEQLANVTATGPLTQHLTSLATLRQQVAELNTTLTPAHYKVQKLNGQIAELEQIVERERTNLLKQIENTYEAAKKRERILGASYNNQTGVVADQVAKATHYHVLQSEVESTQHLYDSMLQKQKEINIASALRASNIQLVDPARAPSIPFLPNYPLNMTTALFAGLVLAMGTAIVHDRTDQRLRRPGEVSRLLNVRELGTIPTAERNIIDIAPMGRLNQENKKEMALELVSWYSKPSPVADSFRSTLTSLLSTTATTNEKKTKVVAVTSLNSAEGKTTVLSNLGITLVETSLRVLLIDGDLRRPRLHTVFNVSNTSGVTDLLGGEASIDSLPIDTFIQKTQIPNLSVLTAGPGTDRFTSLFHLDRTRKLIDRLASQYDVVLIDTPPVSQFADARILGRLCSGVVMVVRARRSTPEQIQAMHRCFVEDRIPVLGTILNDWRPLDGNVKYGY